jgi:hypothetical protein
MERRIELCAGLGATFLGLIGVVVEAQALANPLTNPLISWQLGMRGSGITWDTIENIQHALFPMAIALALLGIGTYLYAVHDRVVGLALLVTCTGAVIGATGFAVFSRTYVAMLFVPAPLIVLTAVLAAAASICALSTAQVVFPDVRCSILRVVVHGPVRPQSSSVPRHVGR